jgi:hypothetical protein
MLGGCWAAVLEVVSRLDELHATAAAAGGAAGRDFGGGGGTSNVGGGGGGGVIGGGGGGGGGDNQGVRSPLRMRPPEGSVRAAQGPGITGPARTESGVVSHAFADYGGAAHVQFS